MIDQFYQSLDTILEQARVPKSTEILFKGLYVLSPRSEYVTDFDEATFTANHAPVRMRGICSLEVVYNNQVIGDVNFNTPNQRNIVLEYEAARVAVSQEVLNLNSLGYSIKFDPLEKGYRQRFMEGIDLPNFGHITLGEKGLDEKTAKILIDVLESPRVDSEISDLSARLRELYGDREKHN